MENSYGIDVTNKFALFFDNDDDESDPLDILKLQETLRETKEKTSKKTPSDSKATKNNQNKEQSTKKDQQSNATTQKREERPARTKAGKGNENETREKRPPLTDNSKDAFARQDRRDPERQRPRSANFRPREDVNASNRGEQVEKSGAPEDEDQSGFRVRSNRSNRQRSENEPSQADGTDKVERPFGTGESGGESFRGRGFGRGRGVGGRGRGRGGFERGGRREFDRHSGSDRGGIKPQDKRDGAGAHNWGSVNEDIEERLEEKKQEGEATEPTESTAPTTDEAKPEGAEEEASPGKAVEEGEAVMTLDEWRAQEGNRRVKSEFNIRKPGEGCHDPQWKKMFVLKKKETEPAEEEEEEEEQEEQHGKAKNVIPIEIKFNTAVRRGGGGRGRGRGRGGFGGSEDGARPDRADRPPRGGGNSTAAVRKQKAPNVTDELDFPSLDKAVAAQ